MSLFTRSKPPPPPARPDPDKSPFEQRVHRIGADLVERARRSRGGLLSTAFWSDKLMDWAMKDDAFKLQLFRFVDTLPTLTNAEDVHDHLTDFLGQPGVTLPPGLGATMKAGGLLKGTMTKTLTGRITSMAEKFIGGTDADSALPMLEKLWKRGIGFSVDLLGEACVSRHEAEAYQARYLDLIRRLPVATARWPANERLETDDVGPVPRTNVSIKITSLVPRLDPIAADSVMGALSAALRPILDAAREHDVLINFDMEQFALKELTLELFMRCCEEVDFPAGLAMQAYLRSGDDDARRVVEWAKRAGRQVTVRLVKGAYWDYETIAAETEGWPVPVWSRKDDTDACFERMSRIFIEGRPARTSDGGVRLALGSHNARSIAAALAMLEEHHLPMSAIELQMLHGMADELKAAAVELGLRVREYVPVGEMLPGMAYLVRRLLENTSNESWLRAGFAEDVPIDRLLASPHRAAGGAPEIDPGVTRIEAAPERHALSPSDPAIGDGRPFRNEPRRNFAKPRVRERFAGAIERDTVPGERASADPLQTLAAASAAEASWGAAGIPERAVVLVAAAERMRARRDALAGLVIREAGMTWRDADCEVCDAIDFCEYFARQAVSLRPRRLGAFVGELTALVHEPRGVTMIAAPWSRPLSALAALTTGALVTGNPVIVAAARQTERTGRLLVELLHDAGAPSEVLHVLPPNAVQTISGDARVRSSIDAESALARSGGWNAIVVDTSANLDDAVLGIRRSAFAFQGQSAAACGRVIVLESRYDAFLERLCESTRGLRIGSPLDPAVGLGPVIDDDAADRIRGFIEVGKRDGRLALALDLPAAEHLVEGRAYVAPHVFTDVDPSSLLVTEASGGPVLVVMKARTFDEAIALANGRVQQSGAVYTRKPAHVELARRVFRAGNLFINQPTLDARVGRQPLAALGLEGGTRLLGGPESLLAFVDSRTISENTMRSGFAPELEG